MMADGGWRMDDGGWRMGDGRWAAEGEARPFRVKGSEEEYDMDLH
jgi:hypothetical protein